jgi:7-cyano-7-deazaguanine synthase in queuosine biosynthesis
MILSIEAPAPSSAAVLLSGGFDSAVCAAWLKSRGCAVTAIQFHHSLRPKREVAAADATIVLLGLERRDVTVDHLGASAYLPRAVQVSAGLWAAWSLGVDCLVMADLANDRPGVGTTVHRLAVAAVAIEVGESIPELWLPFWNISKSALRGLAESLALRADLTWSCVADGDVPCRQCAGCAEREAAGIA